MKHIKILIALTMLMISAQAQALLIEADVTPSIVPGIVCDIGDTICEDAITGNNTNDIRAFLERDYGEGAYKATSGSDGSEDGFFDNRYDTEWVEVAGDESGEPSGAIITYTGDGTPLVCPECYLMVKDGVNGDPSWYLFDLGSWDGMETIILTGFWDGEGVQGAISGLEIYGADENVPEPGILALFGLGLLGIGFTRRKRA